jgi:hypothetical protein
VVSGNLIPESRAGQQGRERLNSNGSGQLQKGIAFEEEASFRRSLHPRERLVCLRAEPASQVSCVVGQARQRSHRAGVSLFEASQNLVSDSVAGNPDVRVGGILAPWKATRDKVRTDLGAPHLQQRPDDVSSGLNRRDSPEPDGARAADRAQENRLRLIVHRVARGHEAVAPSGADPLERRVAQFARPGLRGLPVATGRLNELGEEGNSQTTRGLPHKVEVCIGLSASEPVVDVCGAGALTQCCQDVQERGGVGAR